MNPGNRVQFIGCTKEQQLWGNNDWPPCILNEVYILTDVEVHRQHTKVSLEGITGKFNSVCFKVIH